MQRCPDCDQPLAANDINVTQGMALCPACEKLTPLSKVSLSHLSRAEILNAAPDGCSVEKDGLGARITVSTAANPFFAIFACLFWNGIVSVFVCVAISGLLQNLVGPLPAWFPYLESDEGPISLGMSLFLCLFLTPFLVVGAFLLFNVLMQIVGQVVIQLDEFDSYIATGIGPFQWKRRFNVHQVTAVEYGESSWQKTDNDQGFKVIKLEAERTIKFGTLIPENRMEWLRTLLLELLLNPNGKSLHGKLPYLSWLVKA